MSLPSVLIQEFPHSVSIEHIPINDVWLWLQEQGWPWVWDSNDNAWNYYVEKGPAGRVRFKDQRHKFLFELAWGDLVDESVS